eukprot:CAMPEP_0205944068 /NCGR_PEP_ID=MMETSP1325-20131115/62154_1 /ASSEMBLY_ACC=CAM_ASM_000708 /TAXON_ID=236786 /ORGANISM="Florenciella sp., Strain RCC1007" /LENGTH=32 /DNA_ID= /DNA_START= /DNA_END= /DNA_ORIENTATION=
MVWPLGHIDAIRQSLPEIRPPRQASTTADGTT